MDDFWGWNTRYSLRYSWSFLLLYNNRNSSGYSMFQIYIACLLAVWQKCYLCKLYNEKSGVCLFCIKIGLYFQKSPVNSMVCWTFSFCWQDIALAKNPALFRLIFARLIEVVLSEKPYNIKAFLGALIFSRTKFTIPSLAFGVRKRKNIVHNIRRSDL